MNCKLVSQAACISADLCFSLVVKCEDVVSPARLTLSNQKHSMSFWSRALNQVGRLDPGDGPVEPGVGEQEVICLLDDLLRHGEGDRTWMGCMEEMMRSTSLHQTSYCMSMTC